MGIIFGQLVDNMNSATCEAEEVGTSHSYEHAINDRVLMLVYIAVAALVLIYIYVTCWSIVSQRLAQRVRDRYFRNLLRQEPAFFDDRTAGEVSSRLNGDIQAIQSGTSEKVGAFLASASFFVTAYIVAFIKEARLAGMLVSLIPAFLLMAMIGGGFIAKFSGTMSDAIGSASSIASEALEHVGVIQVFGAAPRLEAKFADHVATARSAGIKKAVTAGIQAGLLYFIAYAANSLAFWQGSRFLYKAMTGHGDSTIGEIYTVVYILVDGCVVLGTVAPLLPLFGGAASAFRKLREDIERETAVDNTTDEGKILCFETPGSVTLKDVSFAYPSRPSQLVLRKVSLDFPAGKHTAIVGSSGSGKSTVQALIARLQSPTEGSILLGGHDIREVNVKSLRGFLGLVQQEPSLLDRSILENIALGLVSSPHPAHAHLQPVLHSSDLSELASHGKDLLAVAKKRGGPIAEIVELVRQAADLADASSFIDRLEKGWGTMAGSGGSLLSGGQRQRVAVARALVRDPKILILDEATASLDSASERRIQAAVERAAENRTVISIAHRLSTIRDADSIIVMQAGEVVEQGSYDELIARENGVFAHLASLQSLAGADEIEGRSTASINETLSASSSKIDINMELDEEKADALRKHTATVSLHQKPEQGDDGNEKEGLTADLPASAVTAGVWRLVRPWFKWIILALIAAAMVGCNFSASGLVFGHTVGDLNPCNTTPNRVKSLGEFYGGILFMLAVVVLLANFVTWSSFGLVAERLLYRVRVLSFRSLLEQPVSWHQSDNRSPTNLLSIITKDSAALGGLSGSIIGTIFSILINFLVAIILSHIIAWKIAIMCLVIVPILLGAGVMQLRSLARFEERHTAAYSRANKIAVEAVNSINTIAALSLEKEIMGTYSRALKAPRKDIVLASAWVNIWLAINNSTGFLVYAFAYWWGSRLIMRGENTQTQFFTILMAMLVSAQLWGQMFTLAPEFSRARASIARIITVLNLGSDAESRGADIRAANLDITDSSGTDRDIEAEGEAKLLMSPSSKGVRVTFDHVSFAYPGRPDVPVLREVSFTIQPAQFCGLVGPSGAGKSTIMSLVQRLYCPTTGTVTIDGVNISKHSFRDDVAIVPQDTALFDGSVKFNVGLGAKPGHEATDAEIEEACRLAQIHDTIMALPQGYDTECGPRASQLSGGQRQRLSIARALVRKPRLLLLDESTSALDAESERALQASLEIVARDVTVIAITHRLHTVQKADVIYVVEGGRIVDKGRHGDLMERSESYRVNALQQMLQ